ncbi:C-C motif chemokine 18-like isoform X2 [Megalobrama amblycephala]|uniref:C-C motif chemokine 18-like isoform X2 n=1 Tax=Megalobrama amblycephala TaxID=75352 RepID=UPI002013D2D4|nr:C-C motif chemokine 18-like isoform X2 [Megalobrama amblycephala]
MPGVSDIPGALLFCAGMRVESQRCCFSFTDRPLPIKLVADYSMTSPQCPKEAVLFKTTKGRQVCANPADSWVQKHIQTIDSKRVSSAAL